MTDITILSAALGGVIIGLAAGLLLLTHKRVAGVSGIASGLLLPWNAESSWRLWFVLGLIASAPLYRITVGEIVIKLDAPLAVLVVAGILVGYGSRLGGGCTSGHGVCGIARLSMRSIVATLMFMLTAGLTVYIQRHVL
ncbi:MAG: hypothetical protein RLZ92_1397 [Pseudomonadota bacterium]|jgi:uncharacterized membrane protein YedE/YeeE